MKVKHKRHKKPQRRETVPEHPDPFEDYGNESPSDLTHEIRSEIDDGNRDLEDLGSKLINLSALTIRY
jgi:hypothetical protein